MEAPTARSPLWSGGSLQICMLTITKQALLDRIGKESVLLDWEKTFGGKSFGNRHLERVNKIAQFLNIKEGGDEFCTFAGAWVHDVSLAFGSDYDPNFVERHTRTFLDKFEGLRGEERDLIVRCAVGHEHGQKDLPVEAMIVHDADVLDKSGMLGVIRHVWKMTNMLENRVLAGDGDLQKLLTHLEEREEKLFTKTAIKLAKKVNRFRELFAKDKKFALDVLPKISQMAMDGKTSDIIANWLINNYDHPSLTGLENQLSCGFL